MNNTERQKLKEVKIRFNRDEVAKHIGIYEVWIYGSKSSYTLLVFSNLFYMLCKEMNIEYIVGAFIPEDWNPDCVFTRIQEKQISETMKQELAKHVNLKELFS